MMQMKSIFLLIKVPQKDQTIACFLNPKIFSGKYTESVVYPESFFFARAHLSRIIHQF